MTPFVATCYFLAIYDVHRLCPACCATTILALAGCFRYCTCHLIKMSIYLSSCMCKSFNVVALVLLLFSTSYSRKFPIDKRVRQRVVIQLVSFGLQHTLRSELNELFSFFFFRCKLLSLSLSLFLLKRCSKLTAIRLMKDEKRKQAANNDKP